MTQRQRFQRQGIQQQRITRAVTHIRLLEVNPGKLAALDQLAPVYLALCQQTDLNAATNLARRVGDVALQACKDHQAVKSLLMQRHEAWRKQHGWP